ncbi:hypothetical protein [Tumidithrix helvetica]|uniref:hypothetical protein n=1 Tax=Tumidithrix helvetica TaxID=3457545 RepID=UPI003CC51021
MKFGQSLKTDHELTEIDYFLNTEDRQQQAIARAMTREGSKQNLELPYSTYYKIICFHVIPIAGSVEVGKWTCLVKPPK